MRLRGDCFEQVLVFGDRTRGSRRILRRIRLSGITGVLLWLGGPSAPPMVKRGEPLFVELPQGDEQAQRGGPDSPVPSAPAPKVQPAPPAPRAAPPQPKSVPSRPAPRMPEQPSVANAPPAPAAPEAPTPVAEAPRVAEAPALPAESPASEPQSASYHIGDDNSGGSAAAGTATPTKWSSAWALPAPEAPRSSHPLP